ncbi:MAG: hypothetical protein IT481_08635 [Gammaproteobacteria bacterium]|nr:hypothetical protein [Gammaproteobacteria bacterium]
MLRFAFATIVLALAALALPALARDDGRWAQADPSIREWIRGLHDKQGVNCCDDADGEEVEGWAFGPEGYRVKVKGEWLDVPPAAVIDGPNRLGYARAWLYHENGHPKVRCFLAGAGG